MPGPEFLNALPRAQSQGLALASGLARECACYKSEWHRGLLLDPNGELQSGFLMQGSPRRLMALKRVCPSSLHGR